MVRNLSHWLMLVFGLLLVAVSILFAFRPAFAQVEQPLIAPSSVWFELWQILQPIIVLLVSTVGPVLVTWLSARVLAVLKVSDQNKQLEIEAKLRDALHQSASNALKYALAKTGFNAGIVTSAALSAAIAYVQDKNPETLQKLGVDQSALRDIIISKVPELMGPGATVPG